MKRQHREVSGLTAGDASSGMRSKARRCSVSNTNASYVLFSNIARGGSDFKTATVAHKCVPTTLGGHRCCPEPLMDLAAKVCASTIPFQVVEDRCVRVPEPVMQKFIYWSFPRLESDIRRYSALSCDTTPGAASSSPGVTSSQRQTDVTITQSTSHNPRHVELENRTTDEEVTPFNNLGVVTSSELEGMEVPFEQGAAMAEMGRVKEPLQIGFHLSGLVESDEVDAPANGVTNKDSSVSYHVAITFDRCKITSASCDCSSGNIFFCRHVVALSIFRIRKPHLITIRSPISETLQQMDRDQLQKLTQYLLAHHNRVLPAAQKVADLLIDPKSDLNAERGAPDPTAGAGLIDEDRWSLEDKQASQHVSDLLQNSNKQQSAVQLQSLLAKVREMLRARDGNGPRLLTLITEELMRHCSSHTHNHPQSSSNQPDICRMMWDQLGLLWVCVVLNPKISVEERQSFVSRLQHWRCQPHCPQDSTDGDSQMRSQQLSRADRTVLSRAVDAGTMRWDDAHLRRILEDSPVYVPRRKPSEDSELNFHDSDGQPLWHEYVPTACARVEALRSHGCEKEAVALAKAIARTIKQKWIHNFKLYDQKQKEDGQNTGAFQRKLTQGLIGHPLHPIHILFDTLTSPDIDNDNEGQEDNQECPKYAAYEVALLTLGQQRTMLEGSHNQEKMIGSEVALIRRLNQVQLNDQMIDILKNVCHILIDGGPASGLGQPVPRDSVPLHNFANYIFHSLLRHDRKLAFRVGIRAMQVPVFHRPEPNFYAEAYNQPQAFNCEPSRVHEVTPGHHSHQHRQPGTRCYITDKLESNQCTLASSLIQIAKGDVMLLREVVESVQRNICNPSHIFQLSHDAYKAATPPLGSQDSSMLNVALQMGMQVLRMTIHGGSWRRTEMVGWLVTCATEIGLCALISIIKSWYTLFTPVEATTMVANCVVSPNTAIRLSLDPRQRDELFHCVCQMAIQCAVKDPQSCALCCLTLCENLPSAFNATYRVIIDSSNDRIDASQLYNIARYLDQRGLRQQAFTVAFAATRCLNIAFNHDAHPATSDLLWTIQLAQSLGRNELTQMVSVVSRKVKCASVLSDVLRTCTSGVNSRDTTNLAHFGERSLCADGPILRPLLEVAISAYVSTIHSKLSHISPRHYTEFIDFLNKARETFLLASNGHTRFAHLKANLKMVYKGKKKLLNLVTLRFG